jgi:hypothetical protein
MYTWECRYYEHFLKHFFIAYRFYFPNGNPTGKQSQETLLKKLSEAFAKYKNNSVRLEELGQVLKVTNVTKLIFLRIFSSLCGDGIPGKGSYLQYYHGPGAATKLREKG